MVKFSNLKLKNKMLLGNILSLSLVAILGIITYSTTSKLLSGSHMVDHTHVVIEDAMKIQGSAVDMETGMRGYLLAGKEDFLTPYTTGYASFVKGVSELKQTVSDNPAQVTLLNEIEQNISAWKADVTEPTIALRREIGDAETMNDMAKLIGEAKGKVYFDKFRGQVATFIERESTLMGERKEQAQKATEENEENVRIQDETLKWVQHTYEVIAEANSILAAAVDMETGMRGYLLAGKEEFLEPYQHGEKTFYAKVASLSETVSDNPAQVQLLNEIAATIKEWQEKVTEPVIAKREIASIYEIVDLVSEARGKTYFDKFRGQITTFIEREQALMDERKQEAASASAKAKENRETIAQASKWVEHTYSVIAQANDLLAAAVDMETGMRGYLLAGQEEFLDPYKAGSATFSQLATTLKETVSDNPAQVSLLEEMEGTINDWVENVTEQNIALRRKIGDAKTMDDMADLIGEARGKAYFDKFREQIETFVGREAALMESRKASASNAASLAKSFIVGGSLLIIVIALAVSLFVTRLITRPVAKAVDLANAIARGDMSQELDVRSKDEIGVLSQALNQIAKDLGAMIKNIAQGVTTLSSSSTELSATSTQLSGNAEQGSAKANDVASSAEELSANMSSVSAAMEESSSNIQMVATSAEEMSATVSEIAQNAERAKGISEQAVAQSKQTSEKMNELGQAAVRIGDVTETITEISEQTNLLALNATIEAARAGEAGKGFAVVANEIKDLAKQTAEATVDIKNQIEGMQNTTDGTIADIEKIGKVIEDINDVITTIATAVEEQSAATSEISENVSQASAGIAEVNENVAQSSVAIGDVTKDISDISQTSGEIHTASGNVSDSANELSRLAEELDSLVKRFKV